MKLISAETLEKHTKTSGVRNVIDQILSPVLLAQRIYGQQILDPDWSFRNNALNYICIAILLTYVIVGTVDFINNTSDIGLICEAIITIFVTIGYPIKIFFFVAYRSSFCEVYVFAKTSLFDIIKNISPERAEHRLDFISKMVKTQYIMVILPTFHYFVSALWHYFCGTRVTLSRTTSILMPMTSPYHETGLALHLIYLFMVTFGLLVVDMWFILLSDFFCEVSNCAVKVLQVERLSGEKEISYANRLNEALGKFYFIHVQLMQYLKSLNELYKWPVLVPIASAMGITCVFMLVITEEPNWQLTTVMLPTCAEVLAYNLQGERIKSKATEMNTALLKFDWINMKIKDRKSYIIIVCYAMKECGIRTSLGTELSLLTLSNFYKGSYQVFAVFNTMKN